MVGTHLDVMILDVHMTVREIVRQHLVTGDFDGLANRDAECACWKGDLEPCGEMQSNCEAAIRVPRGAYESTFCTTEEAARKATQAQLEDMLEDGEITNQEMQACVASSQPWRTLGGILEEHE